MGKDKTEPGLSPVAQLLDEAVRELRVRGLFEERYTPEEIAAKDKVDVTTVYAWKKEYEDTQGKSGLGPWEKQGHRIVRIRGTVAESFFRSKEVRGG